MAWMKQSGRVWMPGLGGISVWPRPLAAKPSSTAREDLAHGQAEALDVGAAEVQEFHRGGPSGRVDAAGGRGKRQGRRAGGDSRPPAVRTSTP